MGPFLPQPPIKLTTNAALQDNYLMMENSQTRMVSMTIEALCNSINSCLIKFPHYLGFNVQILLVLAEWCLPNLPLAIAYELDCRVR